jgi:site-specific recombinase XerD
MKKSIQISHKDELSKHGDLQTLQTKAQEFVAASKSAATKLAYRADWSSFVNWCSQHDLCFLPAESKTVALWITELAQRGRATSSIARALTSICQAHKFFKLPPPTAAAEVTEVFKGIKRTNGTAQSKAKPLVWSDLCKVIDRIPPSFIGRRDRALLAVGWAAALRRSEITALNVEDVDFVPEGMVVTVRKSKTDQESEGYKIGIPLGKDKRHCPTTLLKHWIDLSCIKRGPLFFAIGFKGQYFHINVEHKQRLSDRMINKIIQRSVEGAKFSPRGFSGHSLRAGFITTAASKGTPEYTIQIHTRHRSTKVLRGYIRQGSLFSENPLTVLI